MNDPGVGRLLVASLHQAIADLLPSRLEFYEAWLNPSGLREGRIGLAPLHAVLSFLRQEGDAYDLIVARAGEYTAEWTMAEVRPLRRRLVRALPIRLRGRALRSIIRRTVRSTCGSTRAIVRPNGAGTVVELRASVFCVVRSPVAHPLCGYYAAVIRRQLELFDIPQRVVVANCRGVTGGQCVIAATASPVKDM